MAIIDGAERMNAALRDIQAELAANPNKLPSCVGCKKAPKDGKWDVSLHYLSGWGLSSKEPRDAREPFVSLSCSSCGFVGWYRLERIISKELMKEIAGALAG